MAPTTTPTADYAFADKIVAGPWVLPLLALFHVLVIAASNYLIQFPFKLGFITFTWGSLIFPLVYLATDLTVRLFGAPMARRIIATVMLPALLLSYLVSVLFYQGTFLGASALATLNVAVARVALGSFSAYVIGQLSDVLVFNRLRSSRHWWLAPLASSVVGNFIDTISFFFIAFHQSPDSFMAEHWVSIALADYVYKLMVCLVLMIPAYGLLLKRITHRLR
ncbi:Queuosine precursor transporter [BD1-7 clade bacterium]|nr:Queuosine precursor transporter [BD1-7 clade bacterium]